MRIGIAGNYGNNNQGDEAILSGMLNQLTYELGVDRSEVIVFAKNAEAVRNTHEVWAENMFTGPGKPSETGMDGVLHNLPLMEKLDFLIIGGGGILMDLYIENLMLFTMYGKLARLAGIPYVIYGAGAGPIATKEGARRLKELIEGAVFATVRDAGSKALLEQIGVERPIAVIADPAFQVQAPDMAPSPQEDVQIGVTVLPYHDGVYWPDENKTKYRHYINGMVQNLDALLAARPEVRLHFFSTKHPFDTAVAKEICEGLRERVRCRVYEQETDFKEILKLIAQQDLIIGTRLHSLILGLHMEKPLIAVSYHEKVDQFMKQISAENWSVPVDALHKRPGLFLDNYERMRQNWQAVQARFTENAQSMKTKEPRGMTLIREKLL